MHILLKQDKSHPCHPEWFVRGSRFYMTCTSYTFVIPAPHSLCS